jgi:hypothetical protein
VTPPLAVTMILSYFETLSGSETWIIFKVVVLSYFTVLSKLSLWRLSETTRAVRGDIPSGYALPLSSVLPSLGLVGEINWHVNTT